MVKHKANVKQHFLPRIYLQNFAANDIVWVFNKKSNIAYQKNTKDILYQDDLYTIKNEYDDNGNKVSPLIFESELFASSIEPDYNKVLASIIELKQQAIESRTVIKVSPELLFDLAYHIVIQFLRMPAQQERVKFIYESVSKQSVDIICSFLAQIENNDSYTSIEIESKVTDPALLHAQMTYSNDSMIEQFLTPLYNDRIWDFIIDPEDNICTSDNPFIRYNSIPNQRPFNAGLNTYGGIIMFPLSSGIFVKISDKKVFEHLSSNDRTMRIGERNIVDTFNKMQFDQCHRIVVCKNRAFDFRDKKINMSIRSNNNW